MPDHHLSPNRDDPPTPAAPHVLVVEDNRDLAKLFCDLLELLGCTTDVAFTVVGALEAAKKKMPQLVFCDLGLPGEKNGFAFPRELRTLGNIGDVRLIAATGYGSPEDQARALKHGFESVLIKPFKLAQIKGIIDSVRQTQEYPC